MTIIKTETLPKLQTLAEYAELCNDELGEYYEALLNLMRYESFLDPDTVDALTWQIAVELENCHKATVTKTTYRTESVHTTIELDWDSYYED